MFLSINQGLTLLRIQTCYWIPCLIEPTEEWAWIDNVSVDTFIMNPLIYVYLNLFFNNEKHPKKGAVMKNYWWLN